jgi:twinkle protein
MEDINNFVSNFNHSTRENCPACSGDRKKKNQKTLSVTVKPDAIVYMCWHCGVSGGVERKKFYEGYMEPEKKITKIPTQLNYNVDLIKRFFKDRGVEFSNLDNLPAMTTGTKWFGQFGEEREAVGFIYGDRASPQAIKWRSVGDKGFTASGAARSFYGVDKLDDDDEQLIIVEGECDVIALASVGIKAVSCPNGAPAKVSNNRIDPKDDNKFAYLWEERERIGKCKKIVLATDADSAGEALAEEIARRVGRAKCWKVEFPEGVKDSNDLVRSVGADKTRAIFAKPVPVPLSGVYGAKEYKESVKEIYTKGHGRGVSTGIGTIDNLFTIAEGQLSIVTGMPSSGKSEFVDQIMINLAKNHAWKFAVCSFENPPATHIAKLLEKVSGKPFFEGPTPRITDAEMEEGMDFIDNHFVFLESKDGGMSTLDSIIDRTKQAVMRLGVRGLVIDPYNYIDMGSDESENKQISTMLSRITSFAKAHGIHVWFVAHPAKMYPRDDGTYAVPKGMNISGSAAWFAKADLGITVHRTDDATEIHCWKSRFKWVGQQGTEFLQYNIVNGQYTGYKKPEMSMSEKYGGGKKADFE